MNLQAIEEILKPKTDRPTRVLIAATPLGKDAILATNSDWVIGLMRELSTLSLSDISEGQAGLSEEVVSGFFLWEGNVRSELVNTPDMYEYEAIWTGKVSEVESHDLSALMEMRQKYEVCESQPAEQET